MTYSKLKMGMNYYFGCSNLH